MSNLNNYIRIAGLAALIGVATPTLAHSQGRGGDKGKGKEKKVEKLERVEGGEVVKVRGDDDKRRVVRTTVVAPPATGLVVLVAPTPSIGGVPMVIVLEALPASISLATANASLMGMA